MRWSPNTRTFPTRHTSIPESRKHGFDIAIIGAGIAGLASAYYLCAARKTPSLLLIDYRPPMSFTSAQSGDNYRNWWPHNTMRSFTNDSIDLMRGLARTTDNRFNMSRKGYVLASRRTGIGHLVQNLEIGKDVEILSDHSEIRRRFPALNTDINNVLHIKNAGDIDGQQLGAWMLAHYQKAGGKLLRGEVTEISADRGYTLRVDSAGGAQCVTADVIVNAAGPFAGRVAGMLEIDLPIKNVYQQKIMFEDRRGAIPRDMPFTIDLDEKWLDWSDDERAMLASDSDRAWLAETLPAGTHCRPEGGERGSWVKLGWAYNDKASEPQRELGNEAAIDPAFPEIVLRGAASFLPALKAYVQSPPSRFVHYGGYYTMTPENWPLIGPMGATDRFIVGALSGFGSMSACAAGKLIASWVYGRALPAYGHDLSLARYDDDGLIESLRGAASKGIL